MLSGRLTFNWSNSAKLLSTRSGACKQSSRRNVKRCVSIPCVWRGVDCRLERLEMVMREMRVMRVMREMRVLRVMRERAHTRCCFV